MSIQQVEEYYLDMESSKFNLVRVVDMCDASDLDFCNEGDTFTVGVFYSRDEAKAFTTKLTNYAGAKS